MKVCVTGGLGFIGSNLVRHLHKNSLGKIKIIDDLSTGDMRFLNMKELSNVELVKKNLIDFTKEELAKEFEGVKTIYHLAANADVRSGWLNPHLDVDSNILSTLNVAEAAKMANVKEIRFASTGCVYGDSEEIPTSEEGRFPIQTSMYGTSKLAAEGILSTFASHGAFKVVIFRFVSVLGQSYHHGHVIDFVAQLLRNPAELRVLGDGNQKKTYLDVQDCVSALVGNYGNQKLEVFNIGGDRVVQVSESARLVAEIMDLSPNLIFGKERKGWIGDNPYVHLNTDRIKEYGWIPSITYEDATQRTVRYLLQNQWVIEKNEKRKTSI